MVVRNVRYNDEDDDLSVDSFVSSSNEVSSVDGDNRTASNSREEELKIAQTESKFVLCSKFMAYMVLFLSMVAAGIAAYYFTRDQETSEFEDDVSTLPSAAHTGALCLLGCTTVFECSLGRTMVLVVLTLLLSLLLLFHTVQYLRGRYPPSRRGVGHEQDFSCRVLFHCLDFIRA